MKRREFVSSAAVLAAGSALSGTARGSGGAEVSSLNAPWPLRGSENFAVRSEAVGDSLAVGVWQPDAQMLELTGRTTSGPLDLV